MLTRMAPLLTRMARMLTRITRWLAGSYIIHTLSITHNLIRHILTFCHVKLMQSIALEQGHFDLRQIAPTLPNLWLS